MPPTGDDTASDRVLLITGASSGIGAETARQAGEAGYRLVLAARSEDKLASLAESLGGPERAAAVKCDVQEWADQEAMVRTGLDAFGRIDAVFANAGVGVMPGFQAESPEAWRDMILTNVYGAALTIRASIDALRESKGHLVLTGSVAGRIVYPGSIYSCTKWAITAMGEAARRELQGSGVRVTLIEPGVVDTPFFPEPEPITIEAEDIARAVLYALDQPGRVDVNEVVIRPTAQAE
jgi:NADP-dependent 3-hydroxy acid dehydrogenase YdfG